MSAIVGHQNPTFCNRGSGLGGVESEVQAEPKMVVSRTGAERTFGCVSTGSAEKPNWQAGLIPTA
jgi:hypothetical protein